MFELILAAIKSKAPAVLDATLRVVGLRLLGKALEFPEVWIDGKIQILKDKAEARTIVSRAIASEASKSAISNPQFLQAAVEIVLDDYSEKLLNRAAVFKGALEVLAEADPKEQQTAATPDDDWLNAFARYAEDASSETMQETFARILAGEILSKGTFSRSSMRTLYEMTPDVAKAFSKVWEENIGGCVPRIYDRKDLDSAVQVAKESGFLHNDMQCFNSQKIASADPEFAFCEMNIGSKPQLQVTYKDRADHILEFSTMFPVEVFTKVGREIASILPFPDFESNLRNLVLYLPNPDKIHQILLVKADGGIETLAFPPKPT